MRVCVEYGVEDDRFATRVLFRVRNVYQSVHHLEFSEFLGGNIFILYFELTIGVALKYFLVFQLVIYTVYFFYSH